MKKTTTFAILYYPTLILLYAAFLFLVSGLLGLSRGRDNLGFVIAVTYGVLFVGFPILVCVLMRFSLLKMIVDPIAAACCPAFLYGAMLVNEIRRGGHGLTAAFLTLNDKLSDDGGMGWVFLIGLFLLGLIASVSFARREGKSVSFRILGDGKKS